MKRKWCGIDAEGDRGNTGLLGVAIYSDEEQRYYTDEAEIRLSLQIHAQLGYTFIVYNASYDIPVIFHQLGLDVRIVHYNGRFNHGRWKYRNDGAMAEIWDAATISGIRPLAALGKSIGCEKYSTPASILGVERDKYLWKCDTHNIWECVQCYATRDAEIPYRFMLSLTEQLATWDCVPKPTIASMAVDVWHYTDRLDDIGINDRKIEVLAREAYYGGRVETYKLGKISPCYVSDINSAYPWAMKVTPYPDPKRTVYATHVNPKNVRWDCEGVAEVIIDVPHMYVPPLPYTKEGERLYPYGTLHGSWTLLELRYAISLGCTIREVIRIAFSPVSMYPFTNYIDMLWELRQEYKRKGNPKELMCKLLMNNLYGRLGMSDEVEKRDIRELGANESILSLIGAMDYVIDGRLYLDRTTTLYMRSSQRNVMWAAQTTAAVRVQLHKYSTLQGGALIYSDTDSVFTNTLPVGTGSELGDLRLEQEYLDIVVQGPKLYRARRQTINMPEEWSHTVCTEHGNYQCQICQYLAKAKGVPRKDAYEYLTTGKVTFSRPIKPTEQRHSKVLAGTWIEVTRERHPKPHKRTPNNPYALDEEEGWSDTLPPYVS